MPFAGRLAAVAATATTVLTALAVPAVPTSASTPVDEVYPVPENGVYTVAGHGWGHGHGMSQWGAYGAAKVGGLDAPAILAFYYPGTTPATQPARTVRVRMHAAGGTVVVAPISGQTLSASTTVSGVPACTLPASLDGGTTTVRWWRATAVATAGTTAVDLQATTDGRTWQQAAPPGCDPAWSKPQAGSITFADGPSVALVTGAGTVTRYRGRLRAAFTGAAVYPVNVVAVESYLRSVVPSEMPASWSPAALQAQAVAARTYATYGIEHPKTAYYDVWDDTRDQAYTGIGSEDPRSDAAVSATAGQVLLDAAGHAAFTQFGAADGGWTADGGQPYLPAQRDPYDAAVPNSADTWTTTVPATAISSAFGGQIGALQEIDVTARDGHGQWGGRVTSMTLRGTAGSVVLSGTAFRAALGLRSEWFHLQVPPTAPTYVTAALSGSTATVTWQPPASSSGAPVTGYRVTVLPDGPAQDVPASSRRATVTGLPPAADVQISVAAVSNVGVGQASTVTTKVRRLSAADATGVAVAVSRATFAAGAARSVVLAGLRRPDVAIAAGAFAAAHGAPVLLTSAGSLPAVTRTELRRVLPAGRVVYIVGDPTDIGDGVRMAVRALGYRVVRFAGADPASTAAVLASQTRGVRAVIEVDGSRGQQAVVATPAAAVRHAVLLLTDGARQSAATRQWIRVHPRLPRWAIGAAVAADPRATPVRGANAYQLARAVAQTFFPSTTAVAVAGAARFWPALVAGARLGRLGAPLLLATAASVPPATASYLTATRTALTETDLVGGGLAYYDVESGIQAILLGASPSSAAR